MNGYNHEIKRLLTDKGYSPDGIERVYKSTMQEAKILYKAWGKAMGDCTKKETTICDRYMSLVQLLSSLYGDQYVREDLLVLMLGVMSIVRDSYKGYATVNLDGLPDFDKGYRLLQSEGYIDIFRVAPPYQIMFLVK